MRLCESDVSTPRRTYKDEQPSLRIFLSHQPRSAEKIRIEVPIALDDTLANVETRCHTERHMPEV